MITDLMMNELPEKSILVDVNPYRTRAVLLENGQPVELYLERRDKRRIVGNIYKGRVQNVLPGMFASFININEEKNAFLYAGDIKPDAEMLGGEQYEGKLTPSMICDIIRVGQDIMVQIVKDPIGTKGARATTQISLPGHMLVFMPNYEFIGISKRITDDDERKRLKSIASEVLPKGSGVIIRTAAEAIEEEVLKKELLSLIAEWKHIELLYRSAPSPSLIHEEHSLIFRIVRDVFTPNVHKLIVNDKTQYELLKRIIEPGKTERLELYDEPEDMFTRYGVEEAIDEALSRRVTLKSGAYIVIDRTEALTCIDVNTGKYVGLYSLDKTIVETNKEAAVEIARQLRLRDIGGIIIIDFIDMKDPADRDAVIRTLNQALRRDSTKTVVVGMTGLGLVEVTRKKVGDSISSWLQQPCPYCGGTGLVLSEETVALRLRRDLLDRLSSDDGRTSYEITAHPNVMKLISEFGEDEYKAHPELKKISIRHRADPSLHISEYHIKNI